MRLKTIEIAGKRYSWSELLKLRRGQAGQQSIAQLHSNAETNLALAAHAETWGWKEAVANTGSIDQKPNTAAESAQNQA